LEAVTNSYNGSDKYTSFENQTTAWPIVCVSVSVNTCSKPILKLHRSGRSENMSTNI